MADLGESRAAGAEFSQLARLLFDDAAHKWYTAVILEVGAAILSGVLSFVPIPDPGPLLGAILGIVLLGAAYLLRVAFDGEYDRAETMRRQAAFSEGLGWPIEPWQADEWRQLAGKKIRARYRGTPRDPDYYATQRDIGAKRLGEMTIESAFYTWQLYARLCDWVVKASVGAFIVFVLVTLITVSRVLPQGIEAVAARFILAFIPVVLTANLVAWALQLNRLTSGIQDMQRDLERYCGEDHLDETQVLRLVAEYNCQVASGFPIHNWFFNRWHDEIKDLWRQRRTC